MSSLRRAIITERNRLLKLSPLSIFQEQHASFSTARRSTVRTLKFVKTSAAEVRPQLKQTPALPRSKTTNTSLNDAVRKEPVIWPKPSEIPWQAKVVNSVNLIGRVKIPVQFETSSDGKSWAGTIISQDDDGSQSSASVTSFWIPVIFEGDLAHIAMCHLKEKDYVYVAGHLSVDVPPFKLSEVQANIQVMAHSINFVQNFQSKKPTSISIQQDTLSQKSTRDVAFEEQNHAKLLNDAKSSPVHSSKEMRQLDSDNEADKKNIRGSWRDLLTNSKLWLDNREKKRKGLVKAKYPDFKHKDSGAALWLNQAPPGVLQGLGRLEFFVQDGDSWKDLVENPKQWWDNRSDKKNQKAPDFKNKVSQKALWLADAPSWVLSSLPPVEAKSVHVNTQSKWQSY